MLEWLDEFFCALEGKTPTAERTGLSGTSGERMRQLFAVNGLDGWKDDKEKFKLDLINDIKTFLFGKWEKPWDGSVLFDANGKVISGFYNIHGRGYYDLANMMSLAMNASESPFFITGAQIAKQGGTVTDAKKWVGIISFIPIADDDNKDKIKFMLPKSHTVINVDFVNGIKKPIYKTVEFEKKELNEYIEAFIAELVKRKRVPKLHYDQADSCHYRYTLDFTRESIHLVNINQFSRIEGYYSTLFHEITHSTKNPDRCGRGKNATKLAYANEELVAEMGAMILCSEMGLEYTRQNSISYLKGWLKGVKGDSDAAMLEAYSYACDAAEYLLADIDLARLVPQSMSDRANNVVTESENATEEKPKEKRSKEVDVYGVSMSEIENSHNSKFNDNNGIAMNTVSSEERTLITREWLDAYRNGGDVNKALELYKSIREKHEKKVTGEKSSPEPEITTNYYKINEERKVELYFSKDDYKKLDAEISKKIKSYFLFSRNRGAWVSKGTEARHLTDIAKNAGLVFKERDKRQTFAEELEKKKERAEGRIDSSDRKIESSTKKAERLASEFNRMRKDWSWVTQPVNYSTSGGRAFARSKERIVNNYDKSFKELNKAAYYNARRELAKETLSNKQLQSITYVQNRVKEATKSINNIEKWVAEYSEELENKNIKQERADKLSEAIEKGFERLSYHNEKLAYYKLAEYDLLSKNESSDEVVVYDRESIKELAKQLKVFIKKTTGETVQVTSGVRYITANLRPMIPNEIRRAMAEIMYSDRDWSNNDDVTIGNINTTYLSARPKEWAQLMKRHNPIDTEPTKKVTDENTSTRKAILDIPVSDIFTDEKRFQNRANAYSEDSANRIIKAVENGTFDWAKFDPITIWNDKTGKFWVLSGHSRLAAFKKLAKTNKEFASIPTTKFNGSESEAIDLALNSNTLSTKETDAERAGYYHRMRQQCEVGNLKGLGAARTDCDKQVEAKCRDQEGKNANFVLNLSYLAPHGYIMDSLHATGMERDNDSTNVLRTIANWAGEARRSFPQLSDIHETEIAKWLLGGAYGSKAGQFRKKQDFLERVRVALSKFKGGADDSINIAQNVGKTSFEKEWEKRLDTAKTELADAEKDHAERYAKYLDAVMHGSITNERMLELMKPLTANVAKLREAVDAIKKQHGLMREAEGRQKSLFGAKLPKQKDDVLDICKSVFGDENVFEISNGSDNNFGLAPLGTAKRAKTSRLKGDIGAFLGEFDRHCYTIALKGDKGAGKSRLMFQLVNAYAGARLKCAIVSLEMSPDCSVIQNYEDSYIEPKNKAQIAITGESQSYDSLSKICAIYDVVAIDSWNKVRGAVQTDFDRLQKEHPQCIIISIFQSTTGKVTRGGNMVEYDAGTVIQVNKGGHAVCEKNRYASTDLVFNVFDKQLEKEAQDA